MYKTILPPNASKLETAFDKTAASRFDYDLSENKVWSAQHCPIEFLPFLAWALSVDTWDSDWPEHVKRQVVTSSVYVHRHKGTPAAIKAALNALDLGVTISEWFQHGGAPYTFRADVSLSTRGLTAKEITDIHTAIINTKNARSHLERLRVYLTSYANIKTAMIEVAGMAVTVQPWTPSFPDTAFVTKTAAITHIAQTITVGAQS